jgi:hypothetical protein
MLYFTFSLHMEQSAIIMENDLPILPSTRVRLTGLLRPQAIQVFLRGTGTAQCHRRFPPPLQSLAVSSRLMQTAGASDAAVACVAARDMICTILF